MQIKAKVYINGPELKLVLVTTHHSRVSN